MPRLMRWARHREARDGLLVLGASMVGHAGNYLFYVLATRLVVPAQFAEISALTAVATIAFMPATGVQAALARDVAALRARGEDLEAAALVRRSSQQLAAVQAALLVALLLLTPLAVGGLGLSSTTAWWATCAWLVLGIALQVGLGPLQSEGRFGLVGLVLGGPMGALRPFLLLPLATMAAVTGAMLAMVLATLVGLSLVGVRLRRMWMQGGHYAGPPRRLQSTGVALLALGAFASLTNADLLAAKVLLDPTEAGVYSSAALLGKIALYAPSALSLVLLPTVTRRLELQLPVAKHVLITLGVVLLTGLTVSAAIWIAPASLVTLVFGPEYALAYGLATPLALTMTVAAVVHVHLTMALAGRELRSVVLLVATAILHVIALAILGRSPVGIVTATALAAATAIAAHELLSPHGLFRLVHGTARSRRSGVAARHG